MSMLTKRTQIDAPEGPIFSKMITFVIPLMLTNLIQQLYTVADNVVVGKFSPDPTALGGIGSTSAVIAFLTALFASFSVGTAAINSHDFGKRDDDALSKGIHTSLLISLIVGGTVGFVGFTFARPILLMLDTNEAFLNSAILYMRIRCVGIPFVAIYNSAAATLRSVGDSRSPLYILTFSGLVNVLLNVLFVVGFGMSSDGVAYATLASQILSVVFSLWLLMKDRSANYAVKLSLLKIDKISAKRLLKFAIPGTIQGTVANVMNVFLSAATNSFGIGEIIEARTVASNIDTILSTVLATYTHVVITFVGQNRGAGKLDRVKKSILYAILQSVTVSVVLGQLLLLCRRPLVALFVDSSVYNLEKILEYATVIMTIMLTSYTITGFTTPLNGFLKGMGYALPSMVISLTDVCVVRVVWIFFLFKKVGTLGFLYFVYPVSWSFSAICYIVVSLIIWKKKKRELLRAGLDNVKNE